MMHYGMCPGARARQCTATAHQVCSSIRRSRIRHMPAVDRSAEVACDHTRPDGGGGRVRGSEPRRKGHRCVHGGRRGPQLRRGRRRGGGGVAAVQEARLQLPHLLLPLHCGSLLLLQPVQARL